MKNVVVVGGSSGIGKGIAIEMANKGYNVTVLARNIEKLNKLKLENSELDLKCFSVDMDNDNELAYFLDKFKHPVDILVNAVGGIYHLFGDFDSLSLDDWRETFNINLFLTVKSVKAFLPNLKLNSQSLVINISSLAGERPGVFNPHYGCAKAGLNYLTKYLARSLGSDGIRCVTISPSTLDDETLTSDALDYAEKHSLDPSIVRDKFAKESKAKNPLNRLGSIEEIARLALFISDTSSINGSSIIMDSGEMA